MTVHTHWLAITRELESKFLQCKEEKKKKEEEEEEEEEGEDE